MQVSTGVRCLMLAAGLIPLSLPADPPADVTYTYDELGRLRTGTYSDGRKVDYQYDAAGNRTTVTMGTPPQLALGTPSTITEGANLVFPVTKTGTSPQNVTVDCVPTDGTAGSAGAAPLDDYVRVAQQITFLPSDPSPMVRNCSVATRTDAYYEGNETVNATLQNASAGSTIAVANAVGTITDDDAAPIISVVGDTKAEGTTLTFTVSKSGLTQLTHGINYASADGSAATGDSDYTAVSSSLAFASGQTSQVVNVSTTVDSKYEAAETLALNLSGPTGGATIGTGAATGTINNDDAAPTFAINDPAASNEGTLITFTVTKSGSTGLSHSLNWATANNSAVTPSDYTSGSSSVVFLPADTTQQIQVQTVTDGIQESTESFFVNLTTNASSNGAVISDSQGVGTILNIDGPPTVPTGLISTPPSPTQTSYTISWNASTGSVSYYQLQQHLTSDFINPTTFPNINHPTTFRGFNNQPLATYYYRVRACTATNQCSAYSAVLTREVCGAIC